MGVISSSRPGLGLAARLGFPGRDCDIQLRRELVAGETRSGSLRRAFRAGAAGSAAIGPHLYGCRCAGLCRLVGGERLLRSSLPVVARSTLGAGLGAVFIALCMTLVWQTFRYNTFAAPQIRIQKDRGQRVITDGPYRIVRHPMYASALLMFVGTPLLLGSGGACSLCQSASSASVFVRWARNECCAVSCLDTTTTPGR